jgi:hypothetical protein
LINENIPGQYHIVQDGSTAPNCPIQKDQFTQVNISPNSTEVVDMDNSFITATLNVEFSFNVAITPAHVTANWHAANSPGSSHWRKIFIGFKNSMDALKEHDILVNSTEIWKQHFVPYESYIVNLGRNDYVRKTEPWVSTTYEAARRGDSNNICGVIVDLDLVNGQTFNANTPLRVQIPIKIYLNQFLPLSTMKYLLSFFGRWDIRLWFTFENMVVLPVDPQFTMLPAEWNRVAAGLIDNTAEAANAAKSRFNYYLMREAQTYKGFQQVNLPFKMVTKLVGNAGGFTTVTVEDVVCTPSDLIVETCYSNLTLFRIQMDVYNMLKYKYAQQPLIIPTCIT